MKKDQNAVILVDSFSHRRAEMIKNTVYYFQDIYDKMITVFLILLLRFPSYRASRACLSRNIESYSAREIFISSVLVQTLTGFTLPVREAE